MLVNYRDKCRVCENPNPFEFLNLGNMPNAEGHYNVGEEDDQFVHPLKIFWCQKCNVVQTLHDVDLEEYYAEYSYNVSKSPLVKNFMKVFANNIWNKYSLSEGDLVVDVGSSDGFQLSLFQNLGAKVIGFEPSESLSKISNSRGIETVSDIFDSKSLNLILQKSDNGARVILTQYTFDHIPEPSEFLINVSKVLDPKKGLLVIEVHDFAKIVERREACLFTHEHATYTSEKSISSIFDKFGFKLLSTNLVPESARRGNSMIVVASLKESNMIPDKNLFSDSLEMLNSKETYVSFAKEVLDSHNRFRENLKSLKNRGHTFAGYGAAARGVNTLAISGLNNDIFDYFCDINKNLHGKFLPGAGIPVCSPEHVFDNFVDEIIVFNYGYLKEIKDYYSSYIKNGGKISSILDYI